MLARTLERHARAIPRPAAPCQARPFGRHRSSSQTRTSRPSTTSGAWCSPSWRAPSPTGHLLTTAYHLPLTTITTSHCSTYHFTTSHLLLTTTTYHMPLTTHLSPLARREPSPRASRRAAGSSCSRTCSSSPRRCARRALTATLTPIPTRPRPKPKPKPNQVLREHACGPGALVDARDDIDDWGVAKPAELANLPTERENACVSKGLPVYRALFSRAV